MADEETAIMDEPAVITTPPPAINIDVENIVTEDDTPVDNLFSEKQQRLLTEPLYSSWTGPEPEADSAERRPFLAAANVGLFFSVHQPPLVPDVFLSLDVRVPKNWYEKRHRTYFFWEFGKPPEVVVEIVSNRKGQESSRKRNGYARIGIDYYVVYDPFNQLGEGVLQVFERRVGAYVAHADGYLVGVGLGLTLWEGSYEDQHDTWLRWCDEQGVVIPTGVERAAQAEERAAQAEERAAEEAAARRQAEAELERLRAELARMRDLTQENS
jgi:hypothetical protein